MIDLKSRYPALQHIIDLLSQDNGGDFTAKAVEVIEEGFWSPYLLDTIAEQVKKAPFINSEGEETTISETLVMGEEGDRKILMRSAVDYGYLGFFIQQVFNG